jgi:hypothetical protein
MTKTKQRGSSKSVAHGYHSDVGELLDKISRDISRDIWNIFCGLLKFVFVYFMVSGETRNCSADSWLGKHRLNLLKTEFHQTANKSSVSTSKSVSPISITKTSTLIMFREVMTFYSVTETHTNSALAKCILFYFTAKRNTKTAYVYITLLLLYLTTVCAMFIKFISSFYIFFWLVFREGPFCTNTQKT